ncbi:L-serine ammonia-lyase, iron-sulfur-dependent, subunit alpha [Desulfogranum mediterraneum]|uniref:L-serine ammonia-lyase, iron-sulfur-dependent, subunit alpha n=1 Tax=Desulfogranum mediterraneum TaxID=160661 RepID=UPI00041EE289|nr:L-serine ammonia-lyase, iron-sulfur-dependent, subunit alpha [Desulfogranum mediterraneum]
MDTLLSALKTSLEVTSGCTEPAAIAYAASFIGKYLSQPVTRFVLRIDQRTYKNAFAAGIPHGGERKGSEWALILGFLTAAPERRLALFSALNQELLTRADLLHARDLIQVELVDREGLHIDIRGFGSSEEVRLTLEGGHTRIVHLSKDDQELPLDEFQAQSQSVSPFHFDDTLYQAHDWPTLVDSLYQDEALQKLVQQGIAFNMAAALHGQQYVPADNDQVENLVMGAIFARMNGDPIPVMSCAGSGNKGLTSIIPVVALAREQQRGEETEIKAVLVAVLLTALITSRFGEVSSVCGAQYAAGAGIIGGVLYLRDELQLFDGAYNNFVAAISGGFCDGAKGSCSMRGSIAVSAALSAIRHAESGFVVSSRDGFLGQSFHATLDNLVKYNPLIARFELETIKILQDK